MKKLVLALAFITGLTTVTVAQTTKPAAQKTTAAKATVAKTAPAAATPVKAAPAAATTKTAPAVTPASGNAVVLKKDGTPDKRYKNAAAAGPLKKDGTPDKRFKANKKG